VLDSPAEPFGQAGNGAELIETEDLIRRKAIFGGKRYHKSRLPEPDAIG